MANRISTDDGSLDIAITLSASGGYAPDVMNDLTTRALTLYQQAAAFKQAPYMTVDSIDTDDE